MYLEQVHTPEHSLGKSPRYHTARAEMEKSEEKNIGENTNTPLKTLIERKTVIDLSNAVIEVAPSLADP